MLFMFAIQSDRMLFMFAIHGGLCCLRLLYRVVMLFIFVIQGGRMLFMFTIQGGQLASKDWRR